ncbi:MAG TPA: hypothetical protein VNP72_07725, partial [Longimicrobium sp.]|nr:hypothetical protein [Longimicrobium sp.]
MMSRSTAVLYLLLLVGCDAPPDPGAEAGAGMPSPAAAGVAPRTQPGDTVLLAQALERAAELPNLRGILVSQRGEVILERYTDGAGADRVANVKSAS